MNMSLHNMVESALAIDIWVLVAHLIATIFLLIIITFFAWKPTKKYMFERKKIIQIEIKEIEDTKKKVEENLMNSNLLKNKSIEEAKKILDLAEVDAYSLKEKIKKEAIVDAIHIKDVAEIDIIKKEKELRNNINIEVSNVAIEVAEFLLKKKIDKKSNQKLIDSLIEDIKKS